MFGLGRDFFRHLRRGLLMAAPSFLIAPFFSSKLIQGMIIGGFSLASACIITVLAHMEQLKELKDIPSTRQNLEDLCYQYKVDRFLEFIAEYLKQYKAAIRKKFLIFIRDSSPSEQAQFLEKTPLCRNTYMQIAHRLAVERQAALSALTRVEQINSEKSYDGQDITSFIGDFFPRVVAEVENKAAVLEELKQDTHPIFMKS